MPKSVTIASPSAFRRMFPGFDVAVNPPRRCVAERGANLVEPGPRNGDGKCPDIAQHALQRAAGHELHHEEMQVANLAHAVDGNDVRVLQVRDGDCFLLEPLHRSLTEQKAGSHDLDRYAAVNATIQQTRAAGVRHGPAP
jgi:hypothetical protein